MGKRINCVYGRFLVVLVGVFCVICLHVSGIEASTINVQVEVGSHAGPWNPISNSSYDYGIHDHDSPMIIDQTYGLGFSPGNSLAITYLSGTVTTGTGWPWVDADGDIACVANDKVGSTGKGFPSKYMPTDWDTYLMALVGTFIDSSGIIVGNPFEIGNGPTIVIIPSGATQLQLGINDDKFSDNSGSFSVKVEGAPVPIPGAVWLFGSGLIGLVGLRRKHR
jgi:hypothetical protein